MILTLALVAAGVAVLVAVLGLVYLGTVTGALVLDTGWGRRVRPLGPLTMEIAADRDTVYALLAQPYLGRATRALADKVRVLERGSDMVLAAHRTPIRGRLVAVTVETVTFTSGERIDFRLLRGPVPHVVEKLTLTDTEAGCRLDYDGEMGTDFGALGAWWGRIVARRWQAAVAASMTSVQAEAQRQQERRR
jgi:Polyketide cyclase / dehydrase and lipid transport